MGTSEECQAGNISPDDREAFDVNVLRLVAEGLGNIQIATNLGCNRTAVKYSLERTQRRFGTHRREHSVAEAFRRGLLT